MAFTGKGGINDYARGLENITYSPDDIYIAIMGVTGAGKSTFISKCCRKAEPGIGRGMKSETQEVQVFTFRHNKKDIHLIDTPGFDDTYRTDSDVLKDMAYWLSITYENKKIKLTGIIYLHRITDTRMSGNAYKNLRTFRKMCGKPSMSSVVLATTMWDEVSIDAGSIREADLKDTAEFWGDMVKEGSTMYRHTGDYHSAMNIILHLVNRHSTTVLELQKEMVDQRKPLDDTDAGRELEGEMIKQRQLFEHKLLKTRQEMDEAIARKDKDLIEQIAKDQEEFQKKIDDAQKGEKDLRISMEKLIADKEAQHRKDMEAFDRKLKDQEAQTRKKDDEFKDFMKRTELEREQESKKRAAREAELDAAKEQVEQGDLEKLAVLQAAIEALQEQKQTADEREARLRQEAYNREQAIEQERVSTMALYNQRAQIAAYQQSMFQQEQQMVQAMQSMGGGMGMGMAGGAVLGALTAGCIVM
ncbi:hypothetical protein MMC18_002597 [Xylographa bjoerkii]|nr:hypothetical protein [Xylographa bjoerkii]